MLHLLCVPAGGSASQVFFEKALQQKYEKTLLVTSSKNLVQKARMQGINAANFDYLANDILRQCGRFHVRRISRKEQELIVEGILEDLQKKGKLPYFEKLIDRKGFLRSITSLMDQLGSCGAAPEEIDTAFSHWDGRSATYRQKDWEIANVYREYINYLISHDVYDVAGLYRLAAEELARWLRSSTALKWDTLFFMGFYQFDALQLSILSSLSQCSDVWVALPYEGNRPELYGATEFTYGELMRQAVVEPIDKFLTVPDPAATARTASLQHIVKALRNPEAKPAPADGSIEIWKTDDRTGEMRTVLRDIKKLLRNRNVKPEEVAVVVRRMEDYSGIRSLCDEYGIPVQVPDSATLTASPLFRYIVSLLSSVPIYGREKVESWIAFLMQPLQRIALSFSSERTDTNALGFPTEVVEKLAVSHYYTDYTKLLEDLLRAIHCHPMKILGSDCQTNRPQVPLQLLWDAAEKIQPEAPVQTYCEQVLNILSVLCLQEKSGQLYKDGQLTLMEFKNIVCAGEALTLLLQSLPQDYLLCGYENEKIPCARFTEALTEAAGTVSLALQPENQEGIAVISAVNLEESSFRQVYVLGLRENEFPYLKKENWIYNDRERANLAALGIDLPTSTDSYRKDIRFFANACAAARERLVLTFFTDEEQNASAYIGEMQSLFTDLQISVKKVPAQAEESLSREELELALAREGQTVFLEQLDPGIPEAANSDRKRIGNEANWNGILTDPALLSLVERQIGQHFSASKLETYKSCPFKFLVTYVWRQQSPEEMGENLNPMQQGNLLHKVLERFIGNHLGEQLQGARRKELRLELDRIFTETWQEYAGQGQLYAGDFWQHDKELQQLLLYRWLDSEISYSEGGELRPVYTEKEFGRGNGALMPMDINGKHILLNGKIDRIDKAGNTFFITDYKSGTAPKKAAFLGTDLQLPLYILATEYLLALQENETVSDETGGIGPAQGRGTVIGGGYYVLKDAERQESFLFADAEDASGAAYVSLPWKTYSEITDGQGNVTAISDLQMLKEKTEQVMAEILQGMAQGKYKPTPSLRCDASCPVAKICRWRIVTPDPDGEDNDV